jgi:chromosome segregation ATPase
MDEHTKALVEIKGQIQNIVDGIENVNEKQDALGEDISKIKEAVYHPDIGLYARLRELDARIKDMEAFRGFAMKIFWSSGLAIVSVLGYFLKNQIT